MVLLLLLVGLCVGVIVVGVVGVGVSIGGLGGV